MVASKVQNSDAVDEMKNPWLKFEWLNFSENNNEGIKKVSNKWQLLFGSGTIALRNLSGFIILPENWQ